MPTKAHSDGNSLVSRLLRAWLRLVTRSPRSTHLVVAGLTLALLACSARLTIDARWSALLPEDRPEVVEFARVDDEHANPGALIVAVSIDPAQIDDRDLRESRLLEGIAAVDAALQPLICAPEVDAEDCRAQGRLARYVVAGTPTKWLRQHALHIADAEQVELLGQLLASPDAAALLEGWAASLSVLAASDSQALSDAQLEQLAEPINALARVARGLDRGDLGETDIEALFLGPPALLSPDRSMALVMVAPSVPISDAETLPQLDVEAQRLLEPVVAEYADLRIERTGLAAITRDEMDSVGGATAALTAAALVVVLGLLAIAFRSVWTPLLAVTPIMVGIVWTLGVVALVLGELNLMTAMIMVVLLGLGIDFAIHTISRFDEARAGGSSPTEALDAAFVETGEGVLTGALSTAAAFFALAIADMQGVRQFGIAGGIGVLATLVAAFAVLPPILARRATKKTQRPRGNVGASPRLGTLAETAARWRWVVLVAFTAATAWGAVQTTELRWEKNLMELEPEGLRSIELTDEIIDRFGGSTTFSRVTVDSPTASRELRARLEAVPEVASVDDVSRWLSPEDFGRQRAMIEMLRQPAPTPPFDRTRLTQAGTTLEQAAAELVRVAEARELASLVGAARALRDEPALHRLAAGESSAGTDATERAAENLAAALRSLRADLVASDEPVTADRLPNAIRQRYHSATTDRWLVSIYPRDNVWEEDRLHEFQAAVAEVEPRVTGVPQLVIAMNELTVSEGRKALLLSLAVILLLLALHFRRPLLVALAALPLVSGIAIMVGLLTLLGQRLNFVNLIALPMIVGIGIDDGVHFLHRLLEEGENGLRRTAEGVGRAMVLTSATTMIGFGSLALYLHRGMASLGIALFVGVGACLVVSLLLLPALSRLLTRPLFGPR